ncbi:hypothetical protein [Agromyces subbeticus]|uniref:hypothetical protein n=1 Tax=Agromyces subbeticus TaxID=293890 RepID=UPI0003B7118D|nr:hypothetical protein [Agromyces subbeticus]
MTNEHGGEPRPRTDTDTDRAAVSEAMSVRLSAHWSLYVDWQASHGRATGPADLEQMQAFANECPASSEVLAERVRAVRLGHELQGMPWLAAEANVAPRAFPPGWLDPREVLAGLPTRRFPVGFRGRRDGYLIVLAAELRIPRRKVLAVEHGDVVLQPTLVVAGRTIPMDDDPRRCPRCAVTRWMRVLGEVGFGGRGAGHATLAPSVPSGGHDCELPLDGWWRRAAALAPQIDRYGWMGATLSQRSLTAILSSRLRDSGLPAGEHPDAWTERGYSGRFAGSSSAELADAQDDVDARLAALLARSNELIDQANRDLDFLGG